MPFVLRRLPELCGVPEYVIPIAVEGPIHFILFAVWTLGHKPLPYVRAASTAIDMYADIFAKNSVVMMGDFNSNAIWDRDHPQALNHSAMVARLEKHNLTSAYHHHRQVKHGDEPAMDHTFHLYGHEKKSYHIDFSFIPRDWADRIEDVQVGRYADWRLYSDHRPLLVTLRDGV